MNIRVIEVAGAKKPVEFIAGLVWNPVDVKGFRSQLKSKAAEADADLYVYRKSGKPMVGFTNTSLGANPGQLALGLVICEELIKKRGSLNNALLAFQWPDEDDHCYYLMVRDGFILADGDRFDREEHIRAAFLSDLSAGGWDLLVCPEHWEIPQAQSQTLKSFLSNPPNKGRWPDEWGLKLVQRPLFTEFLKVILVIGLLAAPVYGYLAWNKEKIRKEAALLQAQQAAAAEAERVRQLMIEPWPAMPSVTDFADACDRALHANGVTAANWSLQEFVCKDGAITLKWDAAIPYALSAQIQAFHPQAQISLDGASATVSYPLAMNQGSGAPEPLQSSTVNIHRFNDAKRIYGLQINMLLDKNGKGLPLGGPGAPPPPVPLPWGQFAVDIMGDLLPRLMAAALEGPGFRLQTIQGSFDNGSFKYQLTGLQYVKN